MKPLNGIKALKECDLETVGKLGQTVCSVVHDSLYCDEKFALKILRFA
jgi:hypothetical protein